jgi:hypothetical protein
MTAAMKSRRRRTPAVDPRIAGTRQKLAADWSSCSEVVRDLLRSVLDSEGEIRKLVIVFQKRGKKAEAVHNFETTAEALTFVSGTLRLSMPSCWDSGRPAGMRFLEVNLQL